MQMNSLDSKAQKQRELFCFSQKLSILRPGFEPRRYFSGDSFWQDRQADRFDNNAQNSPWADLDRRDLARGMWNGQSLHRLVIATAAGLGKTTNLHFLEMEICRTQPRLLPFFIRIEDLPKDPRRLIQDCLMPRFGNVHGNERLTDEQIRALLERFCDEARIVLLLDAADQDDSSGQKGFDALVETIKSPLWSNCRIYFSTRPHALAGRRWGDLFGSDEATLFHFVRIEELEEKQQRLLLGDERFDRIPKEARSLLRVPRTIRYLRRVPLADLDGLKTKSDVFAAATKNLIREGLLAAEARKLGIRGDDRPPDEPEDFQVELAENILAAIAFEKFFGPVQEAKKRGDTNFTRPNTGQVDAHQVDTFLRKKVYTRLQNASILDGTVSKMQFIDWIDRVAALNCKITYDIFDSMPKRGPIRWYDASLEVYFAALWVSRYCLSADVPILRCCLVDPWDGQTKAFEEIWRFACEMPKEVITQFPGVRLVSHINEESWARAMSPLFEHAPAFRSTEMMYLAIMNIEHWSFIDHGTLMIRAWQSEYSKIKNDPTHPRYDVARDIEEGFRRCPKDPAEDGIPFWMGSPAESDPRTHDDESPQVSITVTPFLLNRTTITNVAYELFDSSHRSRRWKDFEEANIRPDENDSFQFRFCHFPNGTHPILDDSKFPVVNVTWFDAYCYSIWTESRLPTEAEWEFASRSGNQNTQTNHSLLCHSRCNHMGALQDPRDSPRFWGHTLASTDDRYGENGWGLLQMLGNIWEFCADGYAYSAYVKWLSAAKGRMLSDPKVARLERRYRVVRGGSWIDGSRCSRDAERDKVLPDHKGLQHGFRVARSI